MGRTSVANFQEFGCRHCATGSRGTGNRGRRQSAWPQPRGEPCEQDSPRSHRLRGQGHLWTSSSSARMRVRSGGVLEFVSSRPLEPQLIEMARKRVRPANIEMMIRGTELATLQQGAFVHSIPDGGPVVPSSISRQKQRTTTARYLGAAFSRNQDPQQTFNRRLT